MIQGFATVGHVQVYWKACEDVYLKPASARNYEYVFEQLAVLYSHILEYQLNAICYLAKDKKDRMWQVTAGWAAWSDKAEEITKESEWCKTLLEPAGQLVIDDMNTEQLRKADKLCDATRDISKVLTANRAEDREMAIQSTLKEAAGKYETDKNKNFPHIQGTCQWFFKAKEFCDWRDGKDTGLFWVSAHPGCGKSVLSRALIDDDHLKKTATTINTATSETPLQETTTSICYFFFEKGVQGRAKLTNAFSAILHKLFAEDMTNELIQHAILPYRSNQRLGDEFAPLWSILVKCSDSETRGDIICLLDAFDECEQEGREQLLGTLQEYYSKRQGTHKLKFLITSRPYKTVEVLFDSFSRKVKLLRVDWEDKYDEVSRDMALVIDSRLEGASYHFSTRDRESIRRHLKDQKSKTYLWLHLIFSIIKNRPSSYSTGDAVMEKLLKSIPQEVSESYEEILNYSQDEEMTVTLLQLILAARRPLALAEANYALTMALASTKFQRHQDVAAKLYGADFQSTVGDLCGLIITTYDGCLHFIHLTAHEFLTSSGPKAGLKWSGRFAPETGLHQTMSRCCISYLLLNDFNEMSSRASLLQTRSETDQFPLLKYASINWGYHFRQLDKTSAVVMMADARRLIKGSGPYLKVWSALFIKVHIAGIHSFDGWAELAIASFLGLQYMVEEMLVDEGVSPDVPSGGFIGSALNAAVCSWHKATVELLLVHGARVSGTGALVGNPLDIAIIAHQLDLVKLLISYGANLYVKVPSPPYFNDSIDLAASLGTPKIFQANLSNHVDWETPEGREKAMSFLGDSKGRRFNRMEMLVRVLGPSYPFTQHMTEMLMPLRNDSDLVMHTIRNLA